MAKQKGGLGRGLNALFDATPAVSTTQPASEPEKKEPAPASRQEEKAPQKAAGAPVEDATQGKAPAARQRPAETIVLSEEAVEHAKVVERAARPAQPTPRKKPTKRTAPTKAAGASPHRQTQPVSSAAQQAETVKKAAAKAASPAPAPAKDAKGAVGEISLDLIQPNPNQPRIQFKPEEIEELAASIKRDGLLQPILVRKVGDHYQIIAGERRWQACKNLKMKTVPVRFWTADENEALELALIENIQRSDLNPIEEAYGYKRLMERRGMTQSEVAQTVSKGRSTIANALRLLDLPEEAQQLLFEEKITAGHARAILSIPSAEGRKTLTNKLLAEKLSVRETEAIARLLAGREANKDKPSKRVPAPASFKKAARGLSRFLSAPVRVKTVKGKNKIEIQFEDEEELQRIVEAISKKGNA